jgi:hypothetical protein
MVQMIYDNSSKRSKNKHMPEWRGLLCGDLASQRLLLLSSPGDLLPGVEIGATGLVGVLAA